MKVLAGAATALSAVNAVNDLVKDPTDFTVSIMLGRSTSQSQTVTDTQSVRGSQVVAGQDITVLARAAGGNAETGLRPVGARCDGSSARCSCTMRTARSRTSGENFGDFFMAPFSSVEASAKPGALQPSIVGSKVLTVRNHQFSEVPGETLTDGDAMPSI